MTQMRAKLRVGAVLPMQDGQGNVVQECVIFHGVSKSAAYPSDGSDEDNTFAKFSPSATLDLLIANPALIGKLAVGEAFYVDFTPAE